MDMLHQQRITQMIQRPGHPMEHGKHPLGLVVKNHVGFTNLFLGEKWDKQKGQCSPATGGLDHGNELVIFFRERLLIVDTLFYGQQNNNSTHLLVDGTPAFIATVLPQLTL